MAEQSVAHGAAEPSGLTMENRSPRPGYRPRYPLLGSVYANSNRSMTQFLKITQKLLMLPIAIIVATPVVLILLCAIIVTYPRSLWSDYCWRAQLRRKGRYKNPAIQKDRLNSGTLIVDSPTVGWAITQCWWTPENVGAISPEPIPTDEDRKSHIAEKPERLELPFDRWVSKRYLDANAGTAILLALRRGEKTAATIVKRRNIPIVKSWSGPIAFAVTSGKTSG